VTGDGRANPFTPDGRLPEGAAKRQAVRSMFDTIAPRYDLVNRVMTFRMDVGWRKRTVASLALAPGSSVLDLACGTGDLCRELARGRYRPIGADLSFGMLAAARTDAPLVHADALRLPFPDDAVDGVTCGFAVTPCTSARSCPGSAGCSRTVTPTGTCRSRSRTSRSPAR
jgi:demethylmenaquinone methyltransferase/2-methoxy-6-polyprenyl-1,4-benzoquinol methylase